MTGEPDYQEKIVGTNRTNQNGILSVHERRVNSEKRVRIAKKTIAIANPIRIKKGVS